MKIKRYHYLMEMINANQFTRGAEVGAATGNTTMRLLKFCPTLELLYVADIWKPVDSPQWSMDNMEEIFMGKVNNNPRVKILKGLSWEQAQYVEDKSLDFVFIDADHSYECVKKDITAWYPKVKNGGVLCGHDINLEGVKRAVSELLNGWVDIGIDHVWAYNR